MGLLRFGTKVLSNLTGSKTKMAALGVGLVGLGAASTAAPAARDALFDVTMGTPDADKYFIGDKLNARYLLGASVGGPVGAGLMLTDPKNIIRFNSGLGPNSSPAGNAAVGAVGGGVLGGVIGAAKGMRKGVGGAIRGGVLGAIGGGVLGGALAGSATAASSPVTGGMQGSILGGLTGSLIGGVFGGKRGILGFTKGVLAGGALGTLAGGAVGTALPVAATASFVNQNKKFYSQSPYARTSGVGYNASVSSDLPASAVRNIVPNPSFRSSSLQTAMDLNASGNIVLGMHNSRRGY